MCPYQAVGGGLQRGLVAAGVAEGGRRERVGLCLVRVRVGSNVLLGARGKRSVQGGHAGYEVLGRCSRALKLRHV